MAAGEQRRLDTLIASTGNTLDEMIDEPCTHVESNGISRTKAAFLMAYTLLYVLYATRNKSI